MNRFTMGTAISRIRRSFARLTRPPGIAEPPTSQPIGRQARQAARSRRDGFAGRFIQDVAAAASVAAGQQADRPGHPRRLAGGAGRWPTRPICEAPSAAPARQHWPATTTIVSRRRTVIPPGLLPHTVQLCIHCRQSPAGFWVSRNSGQAVRRPWCLSCCEGLDRGRCDVIPFDP